ncbi:SGNH/GDSL hydrolase family protein [Streptomyces sp. 8P21H-1]|nr:SGNH/GDSL hydrolase family protein [Streptomyces sp. 8P21H-1]
MRLRPTRILALFLGGAAAVSTVAAGPPSPAAATPMPDPVPSSAAERPSAAPAVFWRGSWAAAQQPLNPNVPGWARQGFANQSVRQAVRLTVGGTMVRVRLSNLYGTTPLRLTGATIARTASGAAVKRGSQRNLTFSSRQWAQIPAGRELDSDPLRMSTTAKEKLTVTLYFARRTGPSTYHSQAIANSYRAEGDHRVDPGGGAYTRSARNWYYLTRIDVRGAQAQPRNGVVALGDSLTDGFGSAHNANNRYPDQLAERLINNRTPRPVLNAGISSNRLLTKSACGGESVTARFRRDVVLQPGTRTVIALVGTNDIRQQAGTTRCAQGAPRITAQRLIDGHRYLIKWAHERGLKAVGATLPPCSCIGTNETIRTQFNQWIRRTADTSSGYDALADFDRALANPNRPNTLRPAYDSGDHVHPNDAGYHHMAQAVPLRQL